MSPNPCDCNLPVRALESFATAVVALHVGGTMPFDSTERAFIVCTLGVIAHWIPARLLDVRARGHVKPAPTSHASIAAGLVVLQSGLVLYEYSFSAPMCGRIQVSATMTIGLGRKLSG